MPAVPPAANPMSAAAETSPDDVEQAKKFKAGDRVTLVGLVRNANLNGQKGTVLPMEGGTATVVPGTVKVHLDLGPEVAVKPNNIIRLDPLASG